MLPFFNKRQTFLYLCLGFQVALAQRSTFDFGNDGWKADGDALNGAAVWQSNGGTPGGYIRTEDASTGGTWYFVAPDDFWGPKCDAYGKFLRYDQFASNNSSPNNNPDIQIKGGGLTLVFNNPILPGTTWTHYDILLREDAGWRINNLTGNTPTQAQFQQVLTNVTSLRIRGEYLSLGIDFGGLDNVILESEFVFEFDLDEDNSSGAIGGDFTAPTVCIPSGAIVDEDLLLNSIPGIDSITLKILGGSPLEFLELDVLIGGITVHHPSPGMMTLVNDGAATALDFATLLKQIQYHDTNISTYAGTRTIQIQVFTDCGSTGATRKAFLPVVLPPVAGLPGDTLLCHGSGLMDLRSTLRGSPDYSGYWQPALQSGTYFFDPNVDSAGTFQYVVAGAFPCANDTTQVQVRIDYPFQLRPDTTICYEKTLPLDVPRGLSSWTWSTGSQAQRLDIDEPGTYHLEGSTGQCTFRDSVAVGFYTCVECPPYAPNIFSPNDDGLNDEWHIFLQCHWSEYLVEVYDRWGTLVFRANDPESTWDGSNRGEHALPGVYVWRMRWTGELFGVPRTWELEGDVTLVH